ncbi:MAG TPA: hypothetical protein VK564_09000 [Thermodesulfobacteriota bacterium]|nr:hypothetical protein [Thermodesulfobacteriota bacterium]
MENVAIENFWLSSNMSEIIECPHQPGNLKITKTACRKRLKASETMTPEMLDHSDLFIYSFRYGLLRCKDCSVAGEMGVHEEAVIPEPFLLKPRRFVRRNTLWGAKGA